MIVMVCVDDKNGMMFNKRRQSQDRVLRQHMLELAGDKKLWMNAYSRKQFPKEDESRIAVAENGFQNIRSGEYCFLEDKDPAQYKEQIEELRSQQMFPSANHDGMPQGNAHSDLSGYMARLDALVSQLEAEKEIAIREYNEIYNQVQLMQDEAEKEVLERRYLLGDSWWRIAVKMNYAESHIYRIHGAA